MTILDRNKERPTAKQDLAGWAAIEDYVQRHDGGKVKDYADDIDTLLVFAGLFSAVLTAFVVETYTMLQEDTGQTTNQLLITISSQLAEGLPANPMPSPTASDSSSTSFVPSTAARWINILFFLSLVFSLAAALFGILAKQWLREYMKWNSTLGIPRENVLIRQLRYEAFEDWHISATISSIPALLELAMIMFLVGLIILLWTLDTVVAIVITVATAVFLGIVSAFTVLPVIFKRCPYKSPTAWACYVLWNLLVDTIVYCVRFCVECFQNLRNGWWPFSEVEVRWPKRPQDWRQREELPDRFDSPMSRQPSVPQEFYEGIQHALTVEKVGLNEEGTFTGQTNSNFARISPYAALKDVFEVSLLFRALSWVYKASQDQQIREHAMLSMETIHTQLPENPDTYGIPNVSDWCILWSLQTDNLRQPELAFSNANDSGVIAVQRKIREMWHSEPTNILGEQRIVSRTRQRTQYGAVHLGVAPDYAPLLVDLVAADLKAAVVGLLEAPASRIRSPEVLAAYGRTILGLLCVLSCTCTRRNHPVRDFHLQGFRSLICERSSKDFVDSTFPGLRSSATMLACRIAYVTSENGQLGVVVRNEQMAALDYSLLICDYYAESMADYNPEDLHTFVLLCNQWLILVDHRIGSPKALEYVKTIINKMADVAEHTLRSHIANCGCYFHLPWVTHCWNARAGHFRATNIDGETRRAYLRLFHALERLQSKGLITGPDQEPLSRLVDMVHRGHPDACEDSDCQDTSASTSGPVMDRESALMSAAEISLRAFQSPSDLPYAS